MLFDRLSTAQLVKIDAFVHTHAWVPTPIQRAVCDAFDWVMSGGIAGRKVWPLS